MPERWRNFSHMNRQTLNTLILRLDEKIMDQGYTTKTGWFYEQKYIHAEQGHLISLKIQPKITFRGYENEALLLFSTSCSISQYDLTTAACEGRYATRFWKIKEKSSLKRLEEMQRGSFNGYVIFRY